MERETDIAGAREYLAQLRSGEVQPWVPETVAVAQPVQSPRHADARELGAFEEPLLLAASGADFELRDRDATRVFGRLVDVPGNGEGPAARAQMAGRDCVIAVERDQGRRLVVARLGDGRAVAACHLALRAGGDVWIEPDDWHRLRWNPLARGPSWKLSADGEEMLRVRPLPHGELEFHLSAAPREPVLLVLLVAMVIRAETVPLEQIVIGT